MQRARTKNVSNSETLMQHATRIMHIPQFLWQGLDGIKNKIDPEANGWGPYDFNLYTLSDEEKAKLDALPTTLDEALDALEEDHDYLTAGGVFPELLLKVWIKNKREEAKVINQIPHPAEFGFYYDL